VLPIEADFGDATQRQFDFRRGHVPPPPATAVVPIPVVPGRDGRTYVTYVNAILDERDGRRVVYIAVYAPVPKLNAPPLPFWRGAGYDVRPVDCSDAYPHFGSLRCLVNLLCRS